MGRTRGPYEAEFPVGTLVRVANADALNHFRETWQFHHPLTAEQLSFAGRQARVREVGFYHGGDELYALEALPGLWHEQCLTAVEESG